MGFDIAGPRRSQRDIEIFGTHEQMNALIKRGYSVRIESRKKQREEGPDPRYMNPESTIKALREISEKFPKLTKLYEIGKTTQGRPILALIVSESPDLNDPVFYKKPTILLDALHHAREVMTPEIVLDAAVTLLQGTAKRNFKIQSLLKRWNFALVPMLNMDGSSIVFKDQPAWRKNAALNPEGKIEGVDLNRNYSFNWGQCRGSDADWSSEVFRGPKPSSEPETQALLSFAEKVRPVIYISYHSQGELILYPYGCGAAYTGDNALYLSMGRDFAQFLPGDSSGGFYEPGATWELLYEIDGDSISHLHALYGTLSFHVEINESWQPEYSLRDPTVAKHRRAWQGLLAEAEKKMFILSVIDGKTGLPAERAKVELTNIPHQYGEADFFTQNGGSFYKVLYPNQYNIRVTLKDGRKVTASFLHSGKMPTTLKITVPKPERNLQ